METTTEVEFRAVDVTTIAKGAVVERVAHEMERILENIRDPNTPYSTMRELTLTFQLRPFEDRNTVATRIKTKRKLADVTPVETLLHIGKEKGKLKAFESDPKQEKA